MLWCQWSSTELLVEDNKMQLRDILERGYFSFHLRNTSDSEFVKWDVVAEDANLRCGRFNIAGKL